MSINVIAACDLNRGIGYKNKLMWNLRDDLKHFQKLTCGHFVLMGYNTYLSLGKPLPKRKNIVLTRKHGNKLPTTVFEYPSVEDVLYEYENYAEKEIDLWIIGGQQIYEQWIPHADKIMLTVVQTRVSKADTHFPDFDESDWDKKCLKYQKADENNEYPFYIMEYARKQPN
jgi:dihydrofolate reductase